ncbi:hypothetical protein BDZ97DRAFT_1918581 [Flammula alnicola]|nr:hypothetical protein BDZ97DRAFT_1918581 [Flammula alnicola]
MRADSGLRIWYTRTQKKSDEFYKWFDDENAPSLRKRVGTVVHAHGVRPASRDKTVRYTIIAAEFGRPALTIRWWFGHQFGYNFDLIVVSLTLGLESQYTLRLILQLITGITGIRDVGLSYSHPTRACVDDST